MSPRDYGIELIKLEATKAGAKLVAVVGLLTLGYSICGWFLFAFLLPGAPWLVVVVMLVGMAVAVISEWKMCREEWHKFRRRWQELATLHLIEPLVEAYRAGESITHTERASLHQVREVIISMIARLREEADEWRKQGKGKRGDAFAALLYDLEDAQKLLGEGLMRVEPRKPPVARLEAEPAPVDVVVPAGVRTGLED